MFLYRLGEWSGFGHTHTPVAERAVMGWWVEGGRVDTFLGEGLKYGVLGLVLKEGCQCEWAATKTKNKVLKCIFV